MKEAIKYNVKSFDWKWQTYWDENISTIISRIERWFYNTKEVEIDLSVIDLSKYNFYCPDLFEFITHFELVKKAKLKYPVIVNQTWNIIDWRHRLCKAIIQWKKKLKWIMILDSNLNPNPE